MVEGDAGREGLVQVLLMYGVEADDDHDKIKSLPAKAQQRVDQPRRVDGRYEDERRAPAKPRRRLGKELRQCDAGHALDRREYLKDLGQPSAAFARLYEDRLVLLTRYRSVGHKAHALAVAHEGVTDGRRRFDCQFG